MEAITDSPGFRPAFELMNADSTLPCLLVCDHASNHISAHLANLGLHTDQLTTHIAWDGGAEWVARSLAGEFGATAVLCRHSRLVIDCNRWPFDVSSVPECSEDVVVPGNIDLPDRDRETRLEKIFWPYQRAILEQVERLEAHHGNLLILSIHSFTPVYKGFRRPWQIGVMWDEDEILATRIIDRIHAEDPHLIIGHNKPYSAKEMRAFTLEYHGQRRHHCSITLELRQDLINTEDRAKSWCRTLARALKPLITGDFREGEYN